MKKIVLRHLKSSINEIKYKIKLNMKREFILVFIDLIPKFIVKLE